MTNAKEGSQEYYQIQQEILDEQREQNLENLQRQYEDGLISKEEFEAQKAQIDAEYNEASVENAIAAQQAKFDDMQEKLSQAAEIQQLASNFITSLQDAELKNAEGDEKKQAEIKKKYAVANALSTIAGIGIDTASAIMGTWASYAELGIPGTILAAIQTAFLAATGIAQTVSAIREMNNIKNAKAARGAFVIGASHSDGGVQYELEGGEMVLNKNVGKIPQFRALASYMNESTGGVAFPSIGGSMQFSDSYMIEAIVERTIQGVTQIPVVVSESNISKVTRRVNTIESYKSI